MMEGDSSGERDVCRLDLKESREGFFQRGRERSVHVEGGRQHNAGL